MGAEEVNRKSDPGPEKPLHVRVAEALGWTAWLSKHDYWIVTEPDGTRHEDGFGMPMAKYDSETGKKLPRREWWEEYDPPRYDTDWSASGPLIERFRISLIHLPCTKHAGCEDLQWDAWVIRGEESEAGRTALEAVCDLIVSLAGAGKLPKAESR